MALKENVKIFKQNKMRITPARHCPYRSFICKGKEE